MKSLRLCLGWFLVVASVAVGDSGWIYMTGSIGDSGGSSVEQVEMEFYPGTYGGTPAYSGKAWWGSYSVYEWYDGSGDVILTAQKDGYGTFRKRWAEGETDELFSASPFTYDFVMYPPCTVTGTVYNSVGEVVSNATVELDWISGDGVTEYSTATSADGAYAFTNAGVGRYEVVASLAGSSYAPVRLAITCAVDVAVSADLTLENGGALAGTVTALTGGAAISNASVVLEGLSMQEVVTDAAGSYLIEGLTPGTYSLTVSADGFSDYELDGLVIVKDVTLTQNVEMQQPASLTLVVYAANSAAVAGAAYEVCDANGNTGSGTTDSAGMAVVSNLVPGSVSIQVDEPFHGLYQAVVVLDDGENAQETVNLTQTTFLSGLVRESSASGERIEGASVILYDASATNTPVASDSTDAFGQYRFERLATSDYRVAVSHPAYSSMQTNFTFSASTNRLLLLEPLPGNFFDVYVQMNGTMSGLPVANANVTLEVTDSPGGGTVMYEQTVLTDEDGNAWFRGVPQGYGLFENNMPGTGWQGWWESFTSDRQEINGDKLVNVRLKPVKQQFTVDLDLDSMYSWMSDQSPYLQNFWIEVQGYDPDTGTELYPAQTGLSNADGEVLFEEVPALPTRITVRRPGFEPKSVQLTPDENGEFVSVVTITRPSITSGTSLGLYVDQPVFNFIDGSGAAEICQQGIRNSNTEGFDDTWTVDNTDSNRFSVSTWYGARTPWGHGTYQLTPGSANGRYSTGTAECNSYQSFDYALTFPAQQVYVKEGEPTEHVIDAQVLPARLHGSLMAADRVTEFGEPVYHPVTNTQIRFVIHEDIQEWYTPSNLLHVVTTDESGYYSIELPPGCYGIEIPDMPGYWGEQVVLQSEESRDLMGWPYAHSNTNGWDADSFRSDIYYGYGMSLDSELEARLDLKLCTNRYSIKMPLTEDPGRISDRVLYRNPGNGSVVSRQTYDLLETRSSILLSGDGGPVAGPVRNGSTGLMAVWTNLPPADYTLSGSSHPYLSSTSDVQVVCFEWGAYPGAPPDEEPPDEDDLLSQPIPMHLFETDSTRFSIDLPSGNPVKVIYYNETQEELQDFWADPDFVALTDLPDRVFLCNDTQNELWVDAYYVVYDDAVYAASFDGTDWVANTFNTAPVSLPLAPYTLTVRGGQTPAPDCAIPGLPFTLSGSSATTPQVYSNRTEEAVVVFNGTTSAWSYDRVVYTLSSTGMPLQVDAVIYCSPRVRLSGVVNNSLSTNTISSARLRLYRADGGDVRRGYPYGEYNAISQSTDAGEFAISRIMSGLGEYILEATAPGYLPARQKLVLGDLINGTNTTSYPYYFEAALTNALSLTPVEITLANTSWDRHGTVLHSVKAAGNADAPETGEALNLTAGFSATVPVQIYTYPAFEPGATLTNTFSDQVTELYLVDARRKNSSGTYIPLPVASGTNFYPQSEEYLPPVTDPDKIQAWLHSLGMNAGFVRRFPVTTPSSAVSLSAVMNVAEFYPGNINPVLVARTRSGGCRMLPLGTNLLDSVELPRWLAFATDTLAYAAAAQSTYDDLKETFAEKVPDGKLSALPKLSGGVSEEDGYLVYNYGLGIEWEEGAEAPSKGALSIGPGMLGLKFEAEASVGFNGNGSLLTFEVGGKVGKEEIDLEDYMPGFLKNIGISGTINKVGGLASTKRSTKIDGQEWTERELETAVGAYLDLILRYNLEGVTGKLPYVGPILTVADKTGALQLFGRLDAGGRVETRSIWQTLEADRTPVDNSGSSASGYSIVPVHDDDQELTAKRHCFGGIENTRAVTSNYFALGMSFGASFEGSALGDRLYLRAGVEVTGNENDLVAGEPSLVIIPNTFGDWPPIKRVQGDVNALVDAKLDAYVTELKKSWRMNLARIDYQFTTESLLTMTDLNVSVLETPSESTEFIGAAPVLARNLPVDASVALQNDWVVFGMYHQQDGLTDLVISLADGSSFAAPIVVASGIEGLGLIRLADLGGGARLLVWEERPGLSSMPDAFSVLRAAFYDGTSWGTPQTVVEPFSYLVEMEIFSIDDTLCVVYAESPESRESGLTRLQSVSYDDVEEIWQMPVLVQVLFEKNGVAMACAGAGSEEPGRIVYLTTSEKIYSIFWDGERRAVPDGNTYRSVRTDETETMAICSGGTNEQLYVSAIDEDGLLYIYAYLPDPDRDPLDLDYDWNGRDSSEMWPLLGMASDTDGSVDELCNGWMAQDEKLLSVWTQNGALFGCLSDATMNLTEGLPFAITENPGGEYRDIQICEISNHMARVTARYRSSSVNELRVFLIEVGGTVNIADSDNDGFDDSLELILVDDDPDDSLEDVEDVLGGDDYDGDGVSNADEWAAGTRANDPGSVPETGLSLVAAVSQAREDGLTSGSFLIQRSEDDPAESDLTVYFALSGSADEGTDYVTVAHSVMLPANEASVDIQIVPIADELVEGSETVELSLLPDAGYVLGSTTQAVVTLKDAALSAWKSEMFTEQDLQSSAVSGDAADPDGDGIPNLMEYGMGLDPKSDDAASNRLLIEGTVLQYVRDPLVNQAVFEIEKTVDLQGGTWETDVPTLQCVGRELNTDGAEEVTYEDSSSSTNQGFYRLKLRLLE